MFYFSKIDFHLDLKKKKKFRRQSQPNELHQDCELIPFCPSSGTPKPTVRKKREQATYQEEVRQK